MAKFLPLPPSEEEFGHPSHDVSNRFEVDALLRRKGFHIWERKRGKDPIWILSGVKFAQSEALLRIDARIVSDAKYLEAMDREEELSRLLNEKKK